MLRPPFRPTLLRCLPLEDRLAPAALIPQASFNVGQGYMRQHFGAPLGDDYARAVIVDNSDRIVSAGSARIGDRTIMGLTRLNADGTADTSFGPSGNGRLSIDVTSVIGAAADVSHARDLIDVGNGYLVGGSTRNGGDFDYTAAYIDYSGNLKTSFSGDGILTRHFSGDDFAYDILDAGNGRYMLGGQGANDFLVMAFDLNGNLDTGFNGGGVASWDFGGGVDTPWGMALLPSGSVILGGDVTLPGGVRAVGAVQLTSTGALDGNFGGGKGFASTPSPFDLSINDATLLPDGSFVLVGRVQGAAGNEGLVVKLTSSGSLDTSFGGGSGIVAADFGSVNDEFYAVVPTPGGGFVTVGRTQNVRGDYDVAAMAFDADYNPDFTFGVGGKFTKDFQNEWNVAYAAAVDGAGRVVVVGETKWYGDYDFLAFRLESDVSGLDLDQDGLLDAWETRGGGLDVNGDRRIDLDLYAMGARVGRRDLFVEVDVMNGRTNGVAAAIATVITTFANAPVNSFNGEPNGINLIMTYNENFTFQTWRNPVDGFPPQFDYYRDLFFGTAEQRNDPNVLAAWNQVARYCIVGDLYGTTNSSGIARGIPAQDFMVTLGSTYAGSGTGPNANMLAGTLMHELGHTLGLRHGGSDHVNRKPNYNSIMSYTFQFGRNNPARNESVLPSHPNYSGAGDAVYNDWANILYTWRDGGPGAAGAEAVKDLPDDMRQEEDIFLNDPALTPRLVVAPGPGLAPSLRVLNAQTGTELAQFQAFDSSFTGGVRVARADVTGDGIADVIAGAGPGSVPLVRVFDGVTGAKLVEVLAFEASFTGGVFVSAADFNGDGIADVLISPDQGGGPRVRILSGADGSTLADFFGIEDPNFRGGARIAVGDVDGDGKQDLVVAAGFGGGPRVAVFDGRTVLVPVTAGRLPPKLMGDFFAFEHALRNGTYVTVGDVTGDGFKDLVFGAGPGGGPRVMVVSGAALLQNPENAVNTPYANFFGGDVNSRVGVHVGIVNADNDSQDDVVVGGAPGTAARVTTYAGKTLNVATPTPLRDEVLFDPTVLSGVFVG